MAKIIGNTTATPNPRPDWLQNDPKKADYIKNKPDVVTWTDVDNELNLESSNPVQNSIIAQHLNELENLVTETIKVTLIDEKSTDEQYPTAKATYDFVKAETAAMVDSAPETLDTLNELAAALGDDPNFATTVATQIGQKVDQTRTVNNKALTSDIALTYEDVGADQSGSAATALENAKKYADELVAQQSQVQIITWEADD